MKFDNKTFQQKYEAWKNGADYWKDIRGINLGGDTQAEEPTPEEQELMNAKVQSILNEYDAGKDVFTYDIAKEMKDPLPLFKKGKPVNTARSFYNELVAGGVDPIVAAGIAGNIQQESSFNPDSVSASGTYRGYALLSPAFVNYVRQAYGGYGHKHQMLFLIDMAKGTPKKVKGSKVYADVLSRSKSFRGETYTTPLAAANGWEVYFEKSGGLNMKKRLKYAGDIYNSYYKPQKPVVPTVANLDLLQYSPIVMSSPATQKESTINATVPITLLGPSEELIKAEQYNKMKQLMFDEITTPTPLPPMMLKMLLGNNFGKDAYGLKFWQRRGKNLHFDDGKDPYLYPPTDYDFVQAIDLGYQPGHDGHWPSRNYKTGRYLKSPVHPTLYKGIIADNSLGYYPYYKDGAIYTNTWQGNEPYTGILENYIQYRSKKKKGAKK